MQATQEFSKSLDSGRGGTVHLLREIKHPEKQPFSSLNNSREQHVRIKMNEICTGSNQEKFNLEMMERLKRIEMKSIRSSDLINFGISNPMIRNIQHLEFERHRQLSSNMEIGEFKKRPNFFPQQKEQSLGLNTENDNRKKEAQKDLFKKRLKDKQHEKLTNVIKTLEMEFDQDSLSPSSPRRKWIKKKLNTSNKMDFSRRILNGLRNRKESFTRSSNSNSKNENTPEVDEPLYLAAEKAKSKTPQSAGLEKKIRLPTNIQRLELKSSLFRKKEYSFVGNSRFSKMAATPKIEASNKTESKWVRINFQKADSDDQVDNYPDSMSGQNSEIPNKKFLMPSEHKITLKEESNFSLKNKLGGQKPKHKKDFSKSQNYIMSVKSFTKENATGKKDKLHQRPETKNLFPQKRKTPYLVKLNQLRSRQTSANKNENLKDLKIQEKESSVGERLKSSENLQKVIYPLEKKPLASETMNPLWNLETMVGNKESQNDKNSMIIFSSPYVSPARSPTSSVKNLNSTSVLEFKFKLKQNSKNPYLASEKPKKSIPFRIMKNMSNKLLDDYKTDMLEFEKFRRESIHGCTLSSFIIQRSNSQSSSKIEITHEDGKRTTEIDQ